MLRNFAMIGLSSSGITWLAACSIDSSKVMSVWKVALVPSDASSCGVRGILVSARAMGEASKAATARSAAGTIR